MIARCFGCISCSRTSQKEFCLNRLAEDITHLFADSIAVPTLPNGSLVSLHPPDNKDTLNGRGRRGLPMEDDRGGLEASPFLPWTRLLKLVNLRQNGALHRAGISKRASNPTGGPRKETALGAFSMRSIPQPSKLFERMGIERSSNSMSRTSPSLTQFQPAIEPLLCIKIRTFTQCFNRPISTFQSEACC